MTKIDYRELARFVIAGGIATAGNLSAVWVARTFVDFGVALFFGIAAGMILSFVLTKLFAFRSRELSSTGGEIYRFLIVYGCGLVLYVLAAQWTQATLAILGVPLAIADMAGVLCGAGLMVVTGYLGHRFFTYRTSRSDDAR